MSVADRVSLNRRTLLRAGSFAGVALAAGLSRRAFAETPLKIGIIGSGHIGSTLGTLLVKSGHPVMFSSRHPEQLKHLVQGRRLAKAGTVADAVAFGDVVLLAVPYGA